MYLNHENKNRCMLFLAVRSTAARALIQPSHSTAGKCLHFLGRLRVAYIAMHALMNRSHNDTAAESQKLHPAFGLVSRQRIELASVNRVGFESVH